MDAREQARPQRATRRPPRAYEAAAGEPTTVPRLQPDEHVVELREEQLVAEKEMREVGELRIKKRVEEVPGRLEVEALREEVEVEHIPVGETVAERVAPWEEDGAMYVPVYEEQMVLVKRLVMREKIRIRRVQGRETRLFEDTLKRERLFVDDAAVPGLVHEQFPNAEHVVAADEPLLPRTRDARREDNGLLGNLVRRVLE